MVARRRKRKQCLVVARVGDRLGQLGGGRWRHPREQIANGQFVDLRKVPKLGGVANVDRKVKFARRHFAARGLHAQRAADRKRAHKRRRRRDANLAHHVGNREALEAKRVLDLARHLERQLDGRVCKRMTRKKTAIDCN